MYDLILCVLATTKNNRLEQFQKIGYKPTSKYKTKIVFLQHNEERPSFINEDQEWFDCKNDHFQNRFIEYLKYTKEECRWMMQVDDDSCTDLEETIELLDHYYDYQDNMMLTASCSFKIDDIAYLNRDKDELKIDTFKLDPKLQNILKSFDDKCFKNIKDSNDFDVTPHVTTGWEHCVLSETAIHKIKCYKRFNEYLESCEKVLPEFSDQVPFVLARLAKIPISNCHFFSPLPTLEEYSVINKKGRFSHIHHVAEYLDQKDIFQKAIEEKIVFEDTKQTKEYFESDFENTSWMFYAISRASDSSIVNDPRNQIASRCALKFRKDHKIELLNYPAININSEFIEEKNKLWEIQPFSEGMEYSDHDKILFKDVNNPDNFVVFTKEKNGTYFYNAQNRSFYILSRIDKYDLMYFAHNKLNNPKRLNWPLLNQGITSE